MILKIDTDSLVCVRRDANLFILSYLAKLNIKNWNKIKKSQNKYLKLL